MRIETFSRLRLGSHLGQLRAVPVRLGPDAPPGILAAHAADPDVDPHIELFFFPSDTLKLTLFTATGEILWRKDLGPAVVPGTNLVPICAFDLDGDGIDEIWFVNNLSREHPLRLQRYHLERLDAQTGKTTGRWPWPCKGSVQSLSHSFRNFILGGYANDEPVLVTAQGTYGPMFLQAHRPDLSLRWERDIGESEPGARGSHMAPIADINRDGTDEVMWGERCIELDSGKQLWCADEDTYRGHSDVVQPVLCDDGNWIVCTCREGDEQVRPRVAAFNERGERIWGAVDEGHMHLGWVARLGDHGKTATAIRIDKTGRQGKQACQTYAFDAFTGAERNLSFDPLHTIPVDFNGDGRHELIRGMPGGDGTVWNRYGQEITKVGGTVALARKLVDRPGEQVLLYHEDGTIRIVCDADADRDSDEAKARFEHPYYRVNLQALGGL